MAQYMIAVAPPINPTSTLANTNGEFDILFTVNVSCIGIGLGPIDGK